MKLFKTLFAFLLLVLNLLSVSAQNVAINDDGSQPNPNAILDIKSNTKGLLFPRLDHAKMMALPNIKGMLAVDSNWNTLNYNNGLSWMTLVTASDIKYFPQPEDIGNTSFGKHVFHGADWENTAIGDSALISLSPMNIWTYNTAVGTSALRMDSTGIENTAMGSRALYNNITGSGNTAIGVHADVAAAGLTNATAIGYRAVVDASNKVRIGNAAVTSIEGQVPFTTPSDGRFKFHVQEDVKGLDFILKLRPVTYQFDVEKFDGRGASGGLATQAAYRKAAAIRRSGFIAQEVEKAAQSSGYSFSGIVRPNNPEEHYSLSYESFVVPLVKAVQEQQAQIADLQRQIDELKVLLKTRTTTIPSSTK